MPGKEFEEKSNEFVNLIVEDAINLSSPEFEQAMLRRFPVQPVSAAAAATATSSSRRRRKHDLTLEEARSGWSDWQWGHLLDAVDGHSFSKLNNIYTNTLSLLEKYNFPVGGALLLFCEGEPGPAEAAAMQVDEAVASAVAAGNPPPSHTNTAKAVPRPFEKMLLLLLEATEDVVVLRKAYCAIAAGIFRTQGQQVFKILKKKSFSDKEWSELDVAFDAVEPSEEIVHEKRSSDESEGDSDVEFIDHDEKPKSEEEPAKKKARSGQQPPAAAARAATSSMKGSSRKSARLTEAAIAAAAAAANVSMEEESSSESESDTDYNNSEDDIAELERKLREARKRKGVQSTKSRPK